VLLATDRNTEASHNAPPATTLRPSNTRHSGTAACGGSRGSTLRSPARSAIQGTGSSARSAHRRAAQTATAPNTEARHTARPAIPRVGSRLRRTSPTLGSRASGENTRRGPAPCAIRASSSARRPSRVRAAIARRIRVPPTACAVTGRRSGATSTSRIPTSGITLACPSRTRASTATRQGTTRSTSAINATCRTDVGSAPRQERPEHLPGPFRFTLHADRPL
jgi:hypothetical protein